MQDRFAEKYYSMSPYSFAAGNPIKYIDINGDSLWISHDGIDYYYENGKLFTRGEDGVLAAYKGNMARFDKNGNVKGYKGLLGSTVSTLGSLKSGSGYANHMISTLENSDYNFTINPSQSGSSRVGVDIGGGRPAAFSTNSHALQVLSSSDSYVDWAPFYNIGSGATIYWNINDGAIGFAHELGHGYDANYGLLDSRRVLVNGGYEEIREIRAVYHENMIRRDLGKNLRTGYTNSGPRLIDANRNPILYGGGLDIKNM